MKDESTVEATISSLKKTVQHSMRKAERKMMSPRCWLFHVETDINTSKVMRSETRATLNSRRPDSPKNLNYWLEGY